MEIHQLKTSTSKSAPMAQATERALEEYFNEVVRLREIIAKMKGSFQKRVTDYARGPNGAAGSQERIRKKWIRF